MNPHPERTIQDLLAFVEARAVEDRARTCTICPNDHHLPEVGRLAQDWLRRLRGSTPTSRRLAHTAWIAGIHQAHPDYRSAWNTYRLDAAP